ncbi:MAG TPA: hypothetical protein DCW68_06840 [Rhodospirillaceae bacterium]|nr:MAG: hypothetical protein A2018_01350 [Alphaproteobacteria bacterium GWF2_58_20]HAU29804.1 hypothetical protein [Rhodospirillaceae bacterium]
MSGVFAALPNVFLGAFGESMTWTQQGGAPASVTGIFSAPTDVVNLGGGEIATAAIKADFREDDVHGAARGDTITRGTIQYRVLSLSRDGRGMISMALEVV